MCSSKLRKSSPKIDTLCPSELRDFFDKIETLKNEMNFFVPEDQRRTGVNDFRSDLAGMLVVMIAAMYETCVKLTMISYASNISQEFGKFTKKNFEKLNSKIEYKDLCRYTNIFDSRINENFKSILNRRKRVAYSLCKQEPIKNLQQILEWRHIFAHTGKSTTSIPEVVATHRVASLVILSFHRAFINNTNSEQPNKKRP